MLCYVQKKKLEILTDGEHLIRVIPDEGLEHPGCLVVDGGTCCFV